MKIILCPGIFFEAFEFYSNSKFKCRFSIVVPKFEDLKNTAIYSEKSLLKPSQNKKGRKNFQLHCFLNTFSQLLAVKKYSKNGAAGKFFGPSYFVRL